MNAQHTYKLVALLFTTVLMFVAIAPVHAAAPAGLPTFDKFIKSVANGKAGEVRGVYVANVLALRVVQQPADNPAYVSSTAGTVTQFQMAASQGVTGMLAHNYAAGALFSSLAAGQEVRIVFGDGAVKVPYHHSNVDSDEVLFYSAGDFMSRAGSGIGIGSISYHPAGFVHGPQPGSVEASRDATRTEEIAVMVDTFAPLAVSDAARTISDPDYPWTWAR